MSKELLARMRKNRELRIVVDRFTFTALRPTDIEMGQLFKGEASFPDIAQKFVIGWEGVTEDDVAGGGTKDSIPFDAAVWAEWCAIRPDFWPLIAKPILDAWNLHIKRLEDAAKN